MADKLFRFSAKDAKDLAGLTYRQLNEWEGQGALAAERSRERSWRKFTPSQMFAAMVCGEIRRRYGIPIEKVRLVHDFMMQGGQRNHFRDSVRLMERGVHVFLLTDFETTFILDSDLEFRDMMDVGGFRVDETRAFIFLRVNGIVNRLLGAMKDPIPPLEAFYEGGLYESAAKVRAATTINTEAELDLLQAVRSGRFHEVTVTIADREIREIKCERAVPAEMIDEEEECVILKSSVEFETFVVKKANGKIVHTRHVLPRKYTSEENEPVVFCFVHKDADREVEGGDG